jgi:hypothetical protein
MTLADPCTAAGGQFCVVRRLHVAGCTKSTGGIGDAARSSRTPATTVTGARPGAVVMAVNVALGGLVLDDFQAAIIGVFRIMWFGDLGTSEADNSG